MKVIKKVDMFGTIRHYNEYGFHRIDGPAVETISGSKEWYVNGISHREDGPAIEGRNGYKAWIINGVFHREDGPACQFSDGQKQYWLNGKRYDNIYKISSDEEWRKIVPKILLLE
jgi:hypothetical protein